MKRFLLTCLVFIGLLLLFTSRVEAQGTYTCTWTVAIQGGRTATQVEFCNENQIVNNCEEGYEPPRDPCRFFSELGCESPHVCKPSPLRTNCERKKQYLPCGQGGQKQFQCNRGTFRPEEFCCDSPTACKSATKPTQCPKGYAVISGQDPNTCCRLTTSGLGIGYNCADTKPVGNWCDPGYDYDSNLDACAPQAAAGRQLPPVQPYCDPSDQTSINTALGCIPVKDTNEFVKWVLGWALGIAGGIAFLLILGSGFIIMTASGKPEQLQHGRELLTAAISGLILIIFSVFLLQLIGVQILNIPGL